MGNTLIIQHNEGSDPETFTLLRDGGKQISNIAVPSPYTFPVEGRPNSHLMIELRWYLEQFLEYPFPPETTHADNVLAALRSWATQAFNALFDRRDAPVWLEQADLIQIRSNSPHILSWPWEALRDPQATAHLSHERRVERALNRVRDPQPLPALPQDRVNILLVVARPFEADVRFRSIARPLVELIHTQDLPAHVELLRPPTFEALREHLRAHPGFYHVLHFDGHGSFSLPEAAAEADNFSQHQISAHQMKALQGHLYFETPTGQPDAKSAPDLAALLAEFQLPAVVLNACQSAALDPTAEEKEGAALASVATALLANGTRSVVAMAYSLYVSGAQAFLPAFYGGLFRTGSLADATLEGRKGMLQEKGRICTRGRFPLEDWLLPVLYQQSPLDFSFAAQAAREPHTSRLPPEVNAYRDPYGFIGRDSAILALERSLHLQAPAILIQGLGGVGKTTLARGFLRWLDQTGGLDPQLTPGALWFDFRDIRSADYVLDQTGQAFYGENFRLAPNKLELLTQACFQHRLLIVWDNFESTAANLTPADLAQLAALLNALRGTRAKVLLTSRAPESWLTTQQCIRLELGGLDGEERAEYCDLILHELGPQVSSHVNRNDPAFAQLMSQLRGHPLAMRAVLPRLAQLSATQIAEALKSNITALGLNPEEEQGRLFATLHFVEQGLPQELRPLLPLVGMHQSFLDTLTFEQMAHILDPSTSYSDVMKLAHSLAASGLLMRLGTAESAQTKSQNRQHYLWEMHPLLGSYLSDYAKPTTEARRAFVDVLSRLANEVLHMPSARQRDFQVGHETNFYRAFEESETLCIAETAAILLQFLAYSARSGRRFQEAERLLSKLMALDKHDTGLAAVAHHQLGMMRDQQGDLSEARKHFQQSLQICEAGGNSRGAAAAHHHLGGLETRLGNLGPAKDHYSHSGRFDQESGDAGRRASTLHHQAILAWREDDILRAKKLCQEAIIIKQKNSAPEDSGSSLVLMGQLQLHDKNLVAAKQCVDEALKVLQKPEEAAAALLLRGQIAFLKSEDLLARESYIRSASLSEQINDLSSAGAAYHQLGMMAADMEDWRGAAQWLVKALKSLGPFEQANHQKSRDVFCKLLQHAPPEWTSELEALWQAANLGPFPTQESSE